MRLFWISFAASTVIGSIGSASASTFRTQHADECVNTDFSQAAATVVSGNYGQLQNQTDLFVELYCPVIEDSYQDVTTTTGTLLETVSGWANGNINSFGAKACYTYFNGSGSGGTCGAETEKTGPNVYSLTPSTSVWSGASTDNAFYIAVNLGNQNSGSYAGVFTYETTWSYP